MRIQVGDIIKTLWMKDDHHVTAYVVNKIENLKEDHGGYDFYQFHCSSFDNPKEKGFILNGIEYVRDRCLQTWFVDPYKFKWHRKKEPFTDDMFDDHEEIIIVKKADQQELFEL